jgi:GNAT superfamily N-acetyltransferase
MNDVEIRPALPSEIRRVAELRWQWVLEQGGRPPVAERDAYIDFFAEWAERNPAHHCTVVVRDGVVIGMAWLVSLARVPSPRGLERASGDVQCVYVEPSARNSGLGARLLEAVLARADAMGLEHVTVHSSSRAVTAYERVGFAHSLLHLIRHRPDNPARPGREQVS